MHTAVGRVALSPGITDPAVLSALYFRRQKHYQNATSPPFLSANDTISLPQGSGGQRSLNLTVGQAALAFELMLSPVGEQSRAPWGEGSVQFGIDSLVDPVDAAAFSALLFEQQPDLLLEIGTECGGSAVFFATTMQMYNARAKVYTWDIKPLWKRCARFTGPPPGRRTRKGYKSDLWHEHVRAGRLVPRIADVASEEEQLLVRRAVANASNVDHRRRRPLHHATARPLPPDGSACVGRRPLPDRRHAARAHVHRTKDDARRPPGVGLLQAHPGVKRRARARSALPAERQQPCRGLLPCLLLGRPVVGALDLHTTPGRLAASTTRSKIASTVLTLRLGRRNDSA